MINITKDINSSNGLHSNLNRDAKESGHQELKKEGHTRNLCEYLLPILNTCAQIVLEPDQVDRLGGAVPHHAPGVQARTSFSLACLASLVPQCRHWAFGGQRGGLFVRHCIGGAL